MANDLIKNNIIGALAGAVIVFMFPNILSVSINIIWVPANILVYIGKGLSVIIGAVIGGAIQAVLPKK